MFKKLQYLQGLFQEKRVHGFLTAQINRRVEQSGGKDKRPSLADIKSCGGFEEMADLVFGIHREKVYNDDLDDDVIEINILKQKRGPQGTAAYRYNPGILKLEEWVENPNEEMYDVMEMFTTAQLGAGGAA
jgi:replicative DNA helicase